MTEDGFDKVKKLAEIIRKEIEIEMNVVAAEETENLQSAFQKLALTRSLYDYTEATGKLNDQIKSNLDMAEKNIETAALCVREKLLPVILKVKEKYDKQRNYLFDESLIITGSILCSLQMLFSEAAYNCMSGAEIAAICKTGSPAGEDFISRCFEVTAHHTKRVSALYVTRQKQKE